MYQPYLNKTGRRDAYHTQNPYMILALSFLLTMTVGTLLLMLPFATVTGESTRLVDAAFVAVSCNSVTGLTPVDTYLHWSMFGKLVMVGLIQLGGLGIMTFTTLVAVFLGQRIGLKSRLLLQEDLGQDDRHGLMKVLKRVAKLTFGVEFAGGVLYVIQLYPYIGPEAFYVGFMQSISSFCNAGFIFFDNTLPYVMVTDWLFTVNTCGLIIIGGFGYMSIFDILSNWRRGFISFALHTKIMICGVAILITLGTVLILMLEWSNPDTLAPLSLIDKIQASLFQSVTPRTAGIATLDYGKMNQPTIFLSVILMFVGAGANSTGGGVKISTMAILLVASMSLFTHSHRVEMFERRIPSEQVLKAMGIVLFSAILLMLGSFILAWAEPYPFLNILFEVASAFGTVGLTTGITMDLTDISKWTLILIMYTGRIGVFTLIGAFTLRPREVRPIEYPEGSVLF